MRERDRSRKGEGGGARAGARGMNPKKVLEVIPRLFEVGFALHRIPLTCPLHPQRERVLF